MISDEIASPEISSPFIVRGPRLQAEDEARAIVARAEGVAAAIVVKAEVEARRLQAESEAEAHARAEVIFAEARSRGRDAAAAEAALMMAGTGEAIERFWREREAELRDVAFAIAHRVLSAFQPDETLLRLATEAIAEHARDAQLALKVSPDLAHRLRASLAELDFGDRVTVVPDPSSEPGGCTLLHPRGRTEIGLLAQFRSMQASGGRSAEVGNDG